MIRYLDPPSNIFEIAANAIVIPVNTVGTCGKGLALVAARRWPAWYKEYKRACRADELRPGSVFSHYRPTVKEEPVLRHVLSFATKADWRNPTQIEWVELGLEKLAVMFHRVGAACRTVAVPALGCGNGGLRWADVKPLIDAALSKVAGVDFLVYAPHESDEKPEKPEKKNRHNEGGSR